MHTPSPLSPQTKKWKELATWEIKTKQKLAEEKKLNKCNVPQTHTHKTHTHTQEDPTTRSFEILR